MLSLAVNKSDLDWNYGTLGLADTIRCLVDSGKFNVSYHQEKIDVNRGFRATILIVEGKRIYVDFWEYALPTYSSAVVDADFDLIIKLQHRTMTQEHLERTCSRKKMLQGYSKDERWNFVSKIIPWTFFPSAMLRPFIGKNIDRLPSERIGFFCGKYWKGRKHMIDSLEKQGIECLRSDRLTYNEVINDTEYLRKMRTSRLGIVLGGRASGFTECKNRREIDYMILGVPLALNYRPFYYNPLVEGKHYLYIDKETDLNELVEKNDTNVIVRNATEWYHQNASPSGVVESFMQIIGDKLGVA